MDANQIKATLTTIATKATEAGDHGMALEALDRLGEQKPGIRTSEFWLAGVTSTVGTILLAVPGKEAIGGILMAISVLAYALSRGLAKKPAA